MPSTRAPVAARTGRGIREPAPWLCFYGSAAGMGDLGRVARTFRVIVIDADPGEGNFTRDEIAVLGAGGRNRVLSYLDLGSCESFRTYWAVAPDGLVACRDNTAARLGPYEGYPDEVWMDLGNADYQRLILEHVAPRLVAQGVDGFFLDNLELVEHDPGDSNGPCSPACRQGGLDLVRRLREAYPDLLIVMQNATGDVTRLGTTGGMAFPELLDGVSHEEVFSPETDERALGELRSWRAMGLRPGGETFWIGTEDYVGDASQAEAARAAYAASRTEGFSPYVADASGGQQTVFYWPF